MKAATSIKLFTPEQWLNEIGKSGDKVICPNCQGSGWVEEEVESSQGNWHTIEDHCEQCEDGKCYVDDLTEHQKAFCFTTEYKKAMQEEIIKYSAWTRTPVFENFCKCKQLFEV